MAMDKDELLVDKVNSFLSAHKKTILILVAVLVVSVASLIVYFSFVNKKKNEDIVAIERIIFDLNKEKEELGKKKKEAEEAKKKEEEKTKDEAEGITVDSDQETEVVEKEVAKEGDNEEEKEEPSDPEVLAKEDEAIPKLEELAISSSGYAKYLAFYNIADIYFARKDYSKAKEYYLKALEPVPNSYVAGVLLFNVAVCVEESKGEDSEALEYYQKSSNIEDFPLKPRSLFNVARLQEKVGHGDDAVATYNSIIEKYPDSDFAMIGKSRLIALEIKNKK